MKTILILNKIKKKILNFSYFTRNKYYKYT